MSQQSAQTIRYLLSKCQLSKAKFMRLTGISHASVYKYLRGSPIHPFKARQIKEAIEREYRIKIPLEKLID